MNSNTKAQIKWEMKESKRKTNILFNFFLQIYNYSQMKSSLLLYEAFLVKSEHVPPISYSHRNKALELSSI